MSLVVDRRVELEVSDHDAVLVDHADVEVGHEDQHPLAPVLSSDPDMVELGSIAQGENTGLVDAVPAHFGVGQERLPADLDGGLVELAPGPHGLAPTRGVGTLLVVDVDEAVDLGLELGQGGRGRFLAQPHLQRQVVALDLALGLGMVGPAVFEDDPEGGQLDLHAGVGAPVGGRIDAAVEFNTEVGNP